MSPADNKTNLESFKDEIHQPFTAYLQHATDTIMKEPSLKEKMVEESLKLAYINPGVQLRSLVQKSEESEQFAQLTDALTRTFVHTARASSIIQNFLRRSRFYLRALHGERQDFSEIFDRFWSGIFRRRVKTTNLRPMGYVSFASQCIDFGVFKIQKFAKNELDELVDTETNQIFYPQSVLDTALRANTGS